jgi:predicted transcriptional regulator
MYYMAKETMTVRIEKETRDALDTIAETLDRDRSYVINDALNAYIETNRWHIEHIEQGLREANAGKFISEIEVKKLTDRLRGR